jgi:SAM-dependent methyltransferase
VNAAAPLLNDNGSIIFNGSVDDYLGAAGHAAYAATKGGVVSIAGAIAIDRQAKVLNEILTEQFAGRRIRILDCACGIGTQAWGFARCGHTVTASDVSEAAVSRARNEAKIRGLDISFTVSDMTSMAEISEADFDVVAALDNALAHLYQIQVRIALNAAASKFAPNGLFLASIRDYDEVLKQRPAVQQPAFYGNLGARRIVHQVWNWIDETRYVVHLYITVESCQGSTAHHFASEYRCILRSELSMELEAAAFVKVQWLMPEETSYFQRIVIARRGPIDCRP